MMLVRILLRREHVPSTAGCGMVVLQDFLGILVVSQDSFALTTFEKVWFSERGPLSRGDPKNRGRLVVFDAVQVYPAVTSMGLVDLERRREGGLERREKFALCFGIIGHSEDREERL